MPYTNTFNCSCKTGLICVAVATRTEMYACATTISWIITFHNRHRNQRCQMQPKVMTPIHKAHRHLLGSGQGQASHACSTQITSAIQGGLGSNRHLVKAVADVLIAQVWQRSAGPAAVIAAGVVAA